MNQVTMACILDGGLCIWFVIIAPLLWVARKIRVGFRPDEAKGMDS